MNTEMLVTGGLVILSIGLVIYSLAPRKKDDRNVVKRRLAGRGVKEDPNRLRAEARQRATDELVKKAAPMLSKLIMPTSPEETNTLRMKLQTAGFRQPQAQTIFLGSKTICAVMGLVLGVIGGMSAKLDMTSLFGAVAFSGGAGFMLPNLWLSLAVSTRQEKLRNGLPDVLDLLVVSVESGLALDGAIKRVGDEMSAVHPDLSEELRIATMEAQMGIPRGEALDNMARRTALDEIRSLISVILQAEKFGTSIARALRNQADALRTKRSQAAEERAQKTAVKLMIPLVLFIFPAMGVVLGGPAMLKMIEALKNNPTLN